MTTTEIAALRSVSEIRSELEDVWSCIDRIFDSLAPRDWTRRHGKDWVIADVPHHLSYFDRDVIAIPLERRTGEPGPGEHLFATLRELNDWNARMFALRPGGQSVEKSLRAMHDSRERIRQILGRLTDPDLQLERWTFLTGMGRRRVVDLLDGLLGHTWSHLMQLRHFLKRKDALPSAEATHGALSFYARIMQLAFDADRAASRTTPFVAVMEFTGAGGGSWALRVADTNCHVEELPQTQSLPSDVRLSMAPEAFIKMFADITPPPLLMLTRQIRVRGLTSMRAFNRLFPPLRLDEPVDPLRVSLS